MHNTNFLKIAGVELAILKIFQSKILTIGDKCLMVARLISLLLSSHSIIFAHGLKYYIRLHFLHYFGTFSILKQLPFIRNYMATSKMTTRKSWKTASQNPPGCWLFGFHSHWSALMHDLVPKDALFYFHKQTKKRNLLFEFPITGVLANLWWGKLSCWHF